MHYNLQKIEKDENLVLLVKKITTITKEIEVYESEISDLKTNIQKNQKKAADINVYSSSEMMMKVLKEREEEEKKQIES